MSKTISFNLLSSSVEQAIKELQQYKTELNQKCELFCRRLTELGKVTAEARIAEAPLGKYISVTTTIQPETMGCKAVLLAVGKIKTVQWQTQDGVKEADVKTLMMVEFGSGVKANNPRASEFGMGRGTFPNQTHANDPNGWSWMDMQGKWHSSTGTQATMPMCSASTEMIRNIQRIAREVFRS